MSTPTAHARGPWFDELRSGQVFDSAPAVTLTSGGAALHQAIVGDRLPLATDHELGRRLGGRGPLAHPAYVWDTSIGQSTQATHFVRANLFYRGLVFRRLPALGDTLSTTTTVVGLKQNTPREGKPLTGLAALRITTVDQDGAPVLDFHRCAMLPSPPAPRPPTTPTTSRRSARRPTSGSACSRASMSAPSRSAPPRLRSGPRSRWSAATW